MDAVIIAVAHTQFRQLPVETIRAVMNNNPVLIDVRGMIDPGWAEKIGVYYKKL